MLVVIITEQTYQDILSKIKLCIDNLGSNNIDIFELRLDYIKNHNLKEFAQLRVYIKNFIQKPIIITIRDINNNGKFTGLESERLDLLYAYSKFNPEYIDIEDFVSVNYFNKIKQNNNIKIILSHHNYNKFYSLFELNNLLINMSVYRSDVYKIIGYASQAIDSLMAFDFVTENSGKYNLICHAMGEFGQNSRILGKISGNYFTYSVYDPSYYLNLSKGSLDNTKLISKQCGIVSAQELLNIYNFKRLNKNTTIYGLLGNPVEHSIGHVYHNNNFKINNINSVYVKFKLLNSDLDIFIKYVKNNKLYKGFSITMPYKQKFLQYLDNNANDEIFKINSVNTIKIINNKLYGINTDGEGCIKCFNNSNNKNNIDINGLDSSYSKTVLVLGAGGAAASIIYYLIKYGYEVFVANRSSNNLIKLKKTYKNIKYFSFDDLQQNKEISNFDIIINTLPYNIKTINNKSIDVYLKKFINNNSIFVDINYYNYTKLPYISDINNISGEQMFYNQAELQYKYWFE